MGATPIPGGVDFTESGEPGENPSKHRERLHGPSTDLAKSGLTVIIGVFAGLPAPVYFLCYLIA